jgi:hypothetical protein
LSGARRQVALFLPSVSAAAMQAMLDELSAAATLMRTCNKFVDRM